MQKFLGKTAEYIFGKHKGNLEKVAIVLPNQRANLFLKKHFSELLEHAIWSPKFISIEDFILDISGLQIMEPTDLLFELYALHREIKKDKAESLDEFVSWGNIMLYDFNEIDRYLVDADTLYASLSEIHAMEQWNLDGRKLSDFQKNYLEFWAQLSDYYNRLKEGLLKKKQAYQGLAYRIAAEKINEDYTHSNEHEKIYFVGFNAFTRAEEKIIKNFVKEGKAEMLWDSDAYYMEDPIQEAGDFLRPRWKENKDNFQWIFDDLLTSSKEINIHGVSGNIAQVKLTANLLKKLSTTDELSNTAVVLADEDLLLPLLQSFPANIDKVNITMGLPLNSTPLFHFFNELFQLYLNTERLSKDKSKNEFYYKDFLNILHHQIVQNISAESIRDINRELLLNKLFFISRKALDSLNLPVQIQTLFEEDNFQPRKLLDCILNFIDYLKESESLDMLEQEYLYKFMKIFKRLKDQLDSFSEFGLNLKSLYKLFMQVSSQSSISFYGEPLQGLQLMGVLESRTLDFENVILLSVNEGVLPSGKSQNSFIPYDIKRKFALPSYREKDSIFAYHFYRLLQRAKNVDLIYNNQLDSLNGNEESRFIKQLVQEMPSKNKKVNIKNQVFNIPLIKEDHFLSSISKDPNILQKIREHMKNGISPSALATYIRCPLDYYYKYILKLSQQKDTHEILQSDTFGNIIHQTLHKLYSKLPKEHMLTSDFILQLENDMEKVLIETFEKDFLTNIHNGKNHLIYQVALQYIKNFLNFEKKRISMAKEPIYILSLEQKLECDWEISMENNEKVPLKLYGNADRIEKEGDLIRIIDYKTGSVNKNELVCKDFEELLDTKKSKAMQVFIYSYIYHRMHPESKIISAVYSMKNHKNGLMSFMDNNKGLNEQELTEGKKVLEFSFKTLLSKFVGFQHSEESKYCEFCI